MRQPSSHDLHAARWAMVLRSAEAEYGEIDQALNWINQSEHNRIAFERVQRFLDACDNVAGDAAPANEMTRASKPPFAWRPMLALAASVMFLLVAIPMLMDSRFGSYGGEVATPQAELYASKVGELRTVILPDKSTITLSGASAVLVSLGERERRIELTRGEALFDVSPDPSRPFVVRTGQGTATALGTSFNVHREGDGATVTVVHGRVAVHAAGRFGKSQVILNRSMQATYFGDGAMSSARHVDAETVLAWRSGILMFSGQPLARVISDVNRYSPERIIIEDPDIGLVSISGAVKVNNVREWLRGLQELLGISVERTPGGIILRQARGSKAGHAA